MLLILKGVLNLTPCLFLTVHENLDDFVNYCSAIKPNIDKFFVFSCLIALRKLSNKGRNFQLLERYC